MFECARALIRVVNFIFVPMKLVFSMIPSQRESGHRKNSFYIDLVINELSPKHKDFRGYVLNVALKNSEPMLQIGRDSS